MRRSSSGTVTRLNSKTLSSCPSSKLPQARQPRFVSNLLELLLPQRPHKLRQIAGFRPDWPLVHQRLDLVAECVEAAQN